MPPKAKIPEAKFKTQAEWHAYLDSLTHPQLKKVSNALNKILRVDYRLNTKKTKEELLADVKRLYSVNNAEKLMLTIRGIDKDELPKPPAPKPKKLTKQAEAVAGFMSGMQSKAAEMEKTREVSPNKRNLDIDNIVKNWGEEYGDREILGLLFVADYDFNQTWFDHLKKIHMEYMEKQGNAPIINIADETNKYPFHELNDLVRDKVIKEKGFRKWYLGYLRLFNSFNYKLRLKLLTYKLKVLISNVKNSYEAKKEWAKKNNIPTDSMEYYYLDRKLDREIK